MTGSSGAGASKASRVETFSDQTDAFLVWPGGEIARAHLNMLTDPFSRTVLAFSLTKEAPKLKDFEDLFLRCRSSLDDA